MRSKRASVRCILDVDDLSESTGGRLQSALDDLYNEGVCYSFADGAADSKLAYFRRKIVEANEEHDKPMKEEKEVCLIV